MLALPRFQDQHPCAYLPHRTARMEYQTVLSLTGGEYETLMHQQFRKFGHVLFRPICDGCRECRPLRVPVRDFAPDRSQRRCEKRNSDLTVRVGAPVADWARLDLHNRYHQAQEARRDWPESDRTLSEYRDSFVQTPTPAREISIWNGPELLAVVLCDLTPQTVSAVYHFHAPEYPERGLGTFALLQALRLASDMNKPYLHLGYYVAESRSMSYKARFRPCEVLTPQGWEPLTAQS